MLDGAVVEEGGGSTPRRVAFAAAEALVLALPGLEPLITIMLALLVLEYRDCCGHRPRLFRFSLCRQVTLQCSRDLASFVHEFFRRYNSVHRSSKELYLPFFGSFFSFGAIVCVSVTFMVGVSSCSLALRF